MVTIAFDFVLRPMVDFLASGNLDTIPEAARPGFQRFLNLIRDEPRLFGIPVDGERAFFEGTGLELREFFVIGGEESLKRYATRADGAQVGAEATAAAMERFRQMMAASGDSNQSALMSPERMREQQRLMSYQLAEAVVSKCPPSLSAVARSREGGRRTHQTPPSALMYAPWLRQ